MLTLSRLSCPFHHCCKSLLVISSPLPIAETARGGYEAAAGSFSLFYLYFSSHALDNVGFVWVCFLACDRQSLERAERKACLWSWQQPSAECLEMWDLGGKVRLWCLWTPQGCRKHFTSGGCTSTGLACAAQTECSSLLSTGKPEHPSCLPEKALCLTLPKARPSQFFVEWWPGCS